MVSNACEAKPAYVGFSPVIQREAPVVVGRPPLSQPFLMHVVTIGRESNRMRCGRPDMKQSGTLPEAILASRPAGVGGEIIQ